MARSSDPDATAVITDIEVNETRSFVEWPSVFAGAIIATALALLLTMFGSSLGLYLATPWTREGPSAETLGIAAAIWFAITHIYSVGMGAYFAGRMRPRSSTYKADEVSFRDGTNGLVVWALGFLITAWIAANIAAGAAQVATGVTQVAGQAVSGMASGAQQLAPVAEEAGDRLWRAVTEPAPAPQGQQAQPGQPDQQVQPTEAVTPLPGELTIPTEAQREEALRILRRGLLTGEISEQDQRYLAQLLERTTGLTPEQAEERVETTVKQATAQAKQVVETARETAAFSGFWTAVVLLLSGIAAWWAASLGGSHRDEGTAVRDR